MAKQLVFSGYFGFNNAGDEAILYAMLKNMKTIDPELEITVLSHDPEKTKKQYAAYGIKVINRWRIFDVFSAVSHCDLLLSGGGSLFQDVSSANGVLYYLGIIFLAKFLEKPVMIYAQGIGPLKKKRNRKIASWLLNKVNEITVRDQESKDDLLAMGVQQKITVTADPVLSLHKDGVDQKPGSEILKRYGIKREEGQKLLGVYLRSWEKNDYLPELVDALNKMVEKGWKIVFVPMQFPGDIPVAKEVERFLNSGGGVLLKENYSPEEIMSITKNFDLIVGMRLHSLIMAAVAGVPMVGLSYDPKVDRFLHQVGQIALISVNNFKAQTLVEMLTWTDEKRDDIVTELETRTRAMYQKAWQNARIAINMLEELDSKGE